MYATVWLMLSSLLYALQLQTGSFPRPLTAQEESYYLEKAAQGDQEARNILIERNLRLVAHIMKKGYCTRIPPVANNWRDCVRIRRKNIPNVLKCSAVV